MTTLGVILSLHQAYFLDATKKQAKNSAKQIILGRLFVLLRDCSQGAKICDPH
jgi:hypothetical protein